MSNERERRATAGKRMSSLVGEALDNDEAFWGHEVWKESDEGSGNESFHESDEDSAAKKDVFDSDFNDSESDHEDEEQAAGRQEENEIARMERAEAKLSKGGAFVDVGAARRLQKKKRGIGGKKLVTGQGMNAGIVLNFPTDMSAAANAATASLSLFLSSALPPPATTTGLASPHQAKAPIPTRVKTEHHHTAASTLAATRPRRATQVASKYSSRFRAARNVEAAHLTDSAGSASAAGTATVSGKRSTLAKRSGTTKRKQRFRQEELLLEAANETEPENQRWLLARKRLREATDQNQSVRTHTHGKVVEKYTSRRGYLNVITFPEMDHVPEILTRRPVAAPTKPVEQLCAVTGKRALYRDPITGLGYYDVAAFQELRRKHSAGVATRATTAKHPTSNRPMAATSMVASKPTSVDSTMATAATTQAGENAPHQAVVALNSTPISLKPPPSPYDDVTASKPRSVGQGRHVNGSQLHSQYGVNDTGVPSRPSPPPPRSPSSNLPPPLQQCISEQSGDKEVATTTVVDTLDAQNERRTHQQDPAAALTTRSSTTQAAAVAAINGNGTDHPSCTKQTFAAAGARAATATAAKTTTATAAPTTLLAAAPAGASSQEITAKLPSSDKNGGSSANRSRSNSNVVVFSSATLTTSSRDRSSSFLSSDQPPPSSPASSSSSRRSPRRRKPSAKMLENLQSGPLSPSMLKTLAMIVAADDQAASTDASATAAGANASGAAFTTTGRQGETGPAGSSTAPAPGNIDG